MENGISRALSFDDVLLVPQKTDVFPEEIDLTSRLTSEIEVKFPVMSAAMDTVTEANLAIALAREGGIGVIHRNCSVEEQARLVARVKRSENMVVDEPITVDSETTIGEVEELMVRKGISGIPVLTEDEELVGMVTKRDIRFTEDPNGSVTSVMTERDKLVTANRETSLKEAKDILHQHNVEKLPLVNGDGCLHGIITGTDIEKRMKYKYATYDQNGRLRVAAAIGVSPGNHERARKLVKAGCDVLVLDTATGHTESVREMLDQLRGQFGDLPVVAGNVVTEQGAHDLIDWGASAVKVGLGPGSICTTRVISGVGMPQFTAIRNAARACRERNIPLIADGGIRYSGDILKALAAGADMIMAGSLFAGTDESPGSTISWKGRTFKEYRGMGSRSVMEEGTTDRYMQNGSGKSTPEGVESRVPYKGSISGVIDHLAGGIKSGMGYVGAKSLDELRERAEFVEVSSGGLKESHPHDVVVTEDPVNYTTSVN